MLKQMNLTDEGYVMEETSKSTGLMPNAQRNFKGLDALGLTVAPCILKESWRSWSDCRRDRLQWMDSRGAGMT